MKYEGSKQQSGATTGPDAGKHNKFVCRRYLLNSVANCALTCILYLPLVTQCMALDEISADSRQNNERE